MVTINMRKYLSIIFVSVLCILLTGCGISKSELNKNKEQFKESINKLCEEYDLTDCKIEISDFSKIDNIYVANVELYSDNYSKSKSDRAYLFAKELFELNEKIENDSITYSSRIISKDSKYYYDTEKDIHYLMKDTESVYTIRNGQVMYDIFEKGY